MENALKGSEFLYNHPEKRAEDFINTFKDKSIKGIFSCIGGYESIRMLPGKSYDNQYYEEYKKVIYKVIRD